jgi:hypothetical protein
MSELTIEHVVITDKLQSSLDIGTPGKNGNIKIYFDPLNPNDTRHRIDNAVNALKYLNYKINKLTQQKE